MFRLFFLFQALFSETSYEDRCAVSQPKHPLHQTLG